MGSFPSMRMSKSFRIDDKKVSIKKVFFAFEKVLQIFSFGKKMLRIQPLLIGISLNLEFSKLLIQPILIRKLNTRMRIKNLLF